VPESGSGRPMSTRRPAAGCVAPPTPPAQAGGPPAPVRLGRHCPLHLVQRWHIVSPPKVPRPVAARHARRRGVRRLRPRVGRRRRVRCRHPRRHRAALRDRRSQARGRPRQDGTPPLSHPPARPRQEGGTRPPPRHRAGATRVDVHIRDLGRLLGLGTPPTGSRAASARPPPGMTGADAERRIGRHPSCRDGPPKQHAGPIGRYVSLKRRGLGGLA